jgi:hypothetical protein
VLLKGRVPEDAVELEPDARDERRGENHQERRGDPEQSE